MQILVNPKDGESLLRIVNEPPRGIGNTSIRHIADYAKENSLSLYEAFLNAEANPNIQQRAKNAVKSFIALTEKYLAQKDKLPPFELVTKYIEDTGLMQMYKEINSEDSLDRWNNIQQLVNDIADFFKNDNNADLSDYLQQISLITDIDEKDTSQNQVKLMTLHAAKGLEFPNVFITGLEQGLFPLAKAEIDPEEQEEERRLFYVGITRAEKRLYLSYAQRRMRFGEFITQQPSDFLDEIDKNYIKNSVPSHIIYDKPQLKHRVTPFFSPANKILANQTTNGHESKFTFKAGDRVQHSKFGSGKVEVVVGEGDNAKAVVFFPNGGRKVLMLKYANLKKIG
jgi:DNA helicase-2/ATP-dependent DNA helicase PcrA